LFSALDSMAAMTQVLALIMDGEQGSDWRGNWWPQMGRWVPTTENGKQVIYEKPQKITLQDGTQVDIYMRYDFGLRPGLKWSDGQLLPLMTLSLVHCCIWLKICPYRT